MNRVISAIHCSGIGRSGLRRRDVDEAIRVDAVIGTGHCPVMPAGELLQQRHRDLADLLQQRHELFHGRRRRLVHRSANANVATFDQGLEVRDGPVEEGLIGVRHQIWPSGRAQMSGSNTCQNIGKVNCCLPVMVTRVPSLVRSNVAMPSS